MRWLPHCPGEHGRPAGCPATGLATGPGSPRGSPGAGVFPGTGPARRTGRAGQSGQTRGGPAGGPDSVGPVVPVATANGLRVTPGSGRRVRRVTPGGGRVEPRARSPPAPDAGLLSRPRDDATPPRDAGVVPRRRLSTLSARTPVRAPPRAGSSRDGIKLPAPATRRAALRGWSNPYAGHLPAAGPSGSLCSPLNRLLIASLCLIPGSLPARGGGHRRPPNSYIGTKRIVQRQMFLLADPQSTSSCQSRGCQ